MIQKKIRKKTKNTENKEEKKEKKKKKMMMMFGYFTSPIISYRKQNEGYEEYAVRGSIV